MAIQRCLVLVAALFLNVVTMARCWSLGSASTADCSRLWRQLQGCSSSATCSRGARRPNSTRVITMNRSRKGQAQIEDFSKAMNKVKDFVENVPPLAQDPGLGEILTIARAADARKAQNINALRVAQLTIVTNFMVVLEGTSRPQNQAIAASIIEAMEEEHGRVTKQQGTPDSGWILLDYGDIIIHIMTPKSRAYYDLETFWREGERVDLSGVLVPNTVPSTRGGASFLDEEDEEDPFWS